MTFQISNRWNREIEVYRSEGAATLEEAVLEAVNAKMPLLEADLRGVVLEGVQGCPPQEG